MQYKDLIRSFLLVWVDEGRAGERISTKTSGGSVPQAIEEALRWETPLLSVSRTATEDVEVGGVRIPEGGFVAVSLGAANRGPKRHADPDAFDIFRAVVPHMSFGDGAHKCLGTHLARLEMRVLLNAVLGRLNPRPGGVRVRSAVAGSLGR